MISTLFQNGQRIIVQTLNWAQSAWQTVFGNRASDFSRAGICKVELSEFAITVGNNNIPILPTINIGSGVAYDPLGNRIYISTTDTTTFNATNPSQTTNDGTGNFVSTPQSTGCINVSLTINVINYVWIDYLQTVDTSVFTLQDITLAKQFYRGTDGYRIRVTTINLAPTSNSVFLGSVDLTSAGVVSTSTISQVGRTYAANLPYRNLIQTPLLNKSDATTAYSLDGTYFLDDHIKAIGSGDVTATNPHGIAPADIGIAGASSLQFHQKYLHSPGIIGDSTSTTSSLYGFVNSVNPGFDQFIVYPLGANEAITAANGTSLTSANIPVQTILQFTGSDAPGAWYIYVDFVNLIVNRTQTNLITTPNPNFYLLYTVVYAFPDPDAANGHLSNIIDRRQFGDIAPKNSLDSLSAWIFEKIDACDKSYEFLSYFTSGVDNGSLQTYDLYGVDINDHLEGLSGATTFTNGSVAVTGLATDYLQRFTDVSEGITDPSNSAMGIIASVVDNSNITLTSPWLGPTETVVGYRIKYHVHVVYTYQNDPVLIGQRRLLSSTQFLRFGSVTSTTTTTYNYDVNDNLVNTTTN